MAMELTVKPWTTALLTAFALSATSVYATSSANAACGEIAISKGDVKIENLKTKAATPAVKGTKVCQGDAIVAGPQSRAKIVMEDGNELNVSPDSRIVFEQYEYKPADNKKKVMLNVLYGKVRAATKEENMYGDKAADGQANTFQVKTKSAVAGVRGTDFLTSFNRSNSKAEIVTFKGRVDVGTLGPNGVILNPVSVGPNQKTEALPGSPPAPPKAVPAQEMEKMNTDTKADITSGPKDNGSNQPAQNQDSAGTEKNEDKKESANDGKDSRSNSNRDSSSSGGSAGADTGGSSGNQTPGAAPPPPRSPSSISGGSMIDAVDLGKAPGQSPALPSMPVVPIFAPPVMGTLPTVAPVCDLCNRAIESGPGQVKITITIPN